jgi:phage terminase large subunit-like protein
MRALVLEDDRRWGDIAADFQLEDAAAIFSEDGARFQFLTRPRGGSKTTDVAAALLVWLATEAQPGERGYVVASDRDQAGLVVDSAAGIVDRTPALAAVITVESSRLVARSGATVTALASDSSSTWGLRPTFVVCDEVANWPTTRNARRVWSALISSTGKHPGCRLICLTSSGEPSHWSHKVLLDAKASPNWRVHEVPGPLPWVSKTWLAEQRTLLTDSDYARLHLNVWTQAEDRLVSEEDLRAASVLDGPQEPVPGVRYLLSLDLGITNDRSVAIVAHNAQGTMVVDRIARWRGTRDKPVRLDDVEQWVLHASRNYNHAKVLADPYQAVGMCQRLRANGVNVTEFTFSAQSVGRIANALHLALRNRGIALPDDPDLLNELGRVRLRETTPGVVRLSHDSGEHDDQAVACGMLCATFLAKPTSSVWSAAWGTLAGVGTEESPIERRARVATQRGEVVPQLPATATNGTRVVACAHFWALPLGDGIRRCVRCRAVNAA